MCLCLLSVLNFWQTTRNAEQSCPAEEAFSPLATLVTVWPSSPILLAPNHAGPAQTSVWKQSCRHRHTGRGFPQFSSPPPSSPTGCLLGSVISLSTTLPSCGRPPGYLGHRRGAGRFLHLWKWPTVPETQNRDLTWGRNASEHTEICRPVSPSIYL